MSIRSLIQSTLSRIFVLTMVLAGMESSQAGQQQGALLSEQRKAVLTKALEDRQSIEQTVKAQISTYQPQVIFLGELHDFGTGNFGYEKLLQLFNESLEGSVSCITIEYNSQWQKEISEILKGNLTLEQLEKKAQKKIANWDEIFSFAKSTKIQIYPVDWDSSDWNEAFDKAWDSLAQNPNGLDNLPERPDISGRNHIMAVNLNKLLSSSTCTNVVHLSGASHFSTPKEQDNLQYLVEKPDIRTISFNLQPLKPFFYHGPYPTVLNWPNESWNPAPIQEEFGFVNPIADSFMYPNPTDKSDALPKWSGFNATLFFD